MYFIVFDLEFNMPMKGFNDPQNMAEQLPAEIIEIGAVKLDERGQFLDRFTAWVKPVHYRRMNPFVKKVIGRDTASLRRGLPFRVAAQNFFKWCGSDYLLASWSRSDSQPLRDNLMIHHLEPDLPTRVFDIQAAYQAMHGSGGKGQQVGLEKAMAALGFTVDPQDLHCAQHDAEYTGDILSRLIEEAQFADAAEEQAWLAKYTYNPNLRRSHHQNLAFAENEDVLGHMAHYKVLCPDCRSEMRLEEGWVKQHEKRYNALYSCHKHGPAEARLNYRKRPKGPSFGTLRINLKND